MKMLHSPRRKPLAQAVVLALMGFAAPYAQAATCSDSVTGSELNCVLGQGALVVNPGGELVGTTQAAIIAWDKATSLTNGGRIVSNTEGLNTSNTTNFIVTNYASGQIDGNSNGILIQAGSVLVDNKGSINGSNDSGIQNVRGSLALENTGEIKSNLYGISNLHNSSGATISALANLGKISGGSTSGAGIYNDRSTISFLSNTGLIQGGYGIFNSSSTGGATALIDEITNKGIIYGDVAGIYSNNAKITRLSNSGLIASDGTAIKITGGTAPSITNSGIIAGGNVNGVGYSIQSSVATSITNTGLILGQLSLTGAGSSVTNNSIHALRSKEMSSIAGSYTQGSNGLLSLGVVNDAQYAKLDVTGAATLNGGVYVNLATGHSITAGTVLTNVVTAGTLTGTPTINDNSLGLNFSATQTGTSLTLTAVTVPAFTATPTVAAVVLADGKKHKQGAATAIDSLLGTSTSTSTSTTTTGTTPAASTSTTNTSNPEIQTMKTVVGRSTTTTQVSVAVEQVLPLMLGATQAATSAALTSISRVVQARQESNRGLSSGDDFYGDKHFWAKPFGAWADQDDRDGVSGYSTRTSGVVFGADALLDTSTRVGISFAVARSALTGNSTVAPNSAKVDVYQLLGYGSYGLDADTDLSFEAGIGNNRNAGSRQIVFAGSTATSNYETLVARGGVGLARTIKMSDQTRFIPSVRADYIWMRDSGYNENGAGGLNLKVQSRKTEEFTLSVDGKVRHDLSKETSVYANLGVGYDTMNKQASVTAAFAGAPTVAFTTQGIDASPWLVRGGLAVTNVNTKGMEISAHYDVESRRSFLNQSISAKLRMPF